VFTDSQQIRNILRQWKTPGAQGGAKLERSEPLYDGVFARVGIALVA